MVYTFLTIYNTANYIDFVYYILSENWILILLWRVSVFFAVRKRLFFFFLPEIPLRLTSVPYFSESILDSVDALEGGNFYDFR